MIRPKQRTLYRFAVDTFVRMLGELQWRQKAYRCNDFDVTCWNRFVEVFGEKSLGEDFIVRFCQFGLQSWFNPSMTDLQKHTCRFAWIFSEKAIERYRAVGGGGRAANLVRRSLKPKAEVELLTRSVRPSRKPYLTVRQSEERFKSEFFGTRRGMAWCIANTTLYYHRSPLCARCEFGAECRDVLKRNYENIWRARGYDDRETGR